MITVILMLIFGCIMFGFGWFGMQKKYEIKRKGIKVRGTIRDIVPHVDSTCRYSFKIEFELKDGQTVCYETKDNYSLDFCSNFPRGRIIDVYYLPDKPSEFMVLQFTKFGMGFVMLMIVGMILVFAAKSVLDYQTNMGAL